MIHEEFRTRIGLVPNTSDEDTSLSTDTLDLTVCVIYSWMVNGCAENRSNIESPIRNIPINVGQRVCVCALWVRICIYACEYVHVCVCVRVWVCVYIFKSVFMM